MDNNNNSRKELTAFDLYATSLRDNCIDAICTALNVAPIDKTAPERIALNEVLEGHDNEVIQAQSLLDTQPKEYRIERDSFWIGIVALGLGALALIASLFTFGVLTYNQVIVISYFSATGLLLLIGAALVIFRRGSDRFPDINAKV